MSSVFPFPKNTLLKREWVLKEIYFSPKIKLKWLKGQVVEEEDSLIGPFSITQLIKQFILILTSVSYTFYAQVLSYLHAHEHSYTSTLILLQFICMYIDTWHSRGTHYYLMCVP